MDRRVLRVGDVAKVCQVSSKLVSKWIDRGELPGFRVPGNKKGHRRVRVEDLHAFLIKNDMPNHAAELGLGLEPVKSSASLNTSELSTKNLQPEDITLDMLYARYRQAVSDERFTKDGILATLLTLLLLAEDRLHNSNHVIRN